MKIAKISFDIKILAALALFLAALALPGWANAAEAGKFQFVIGDIKVVSASGAERVPVKGEAFNAGDTIITGASGTAQIRMSDGGLVAVRPDTQLKLDQYIFNGREDGSERKLVSLIKGGFRAITGLIGNRNKDNYKILTPSATIGIRGTDHEAVVIPAGATGGFQVGTYDRVYRGATIIETDKGKLIVNPNQVGFTPGKGAAPVLLPKIPEFFDTKSQKPDVTRDTQKDSKDSSDGGDTKSADTVKGTSTRSLTTLKSDAATTTLKDTDGGKDATATLRSPLETTKSVKDLGSTKLKTDALSTPLSDTTLRSSTTSVLKDTTGATSTLKSDALTTPITVPTTTLKSSDVLTTPITATPAATIKTPVTTTITTPITTITTTPKVTETLSTPVTVPRATVITKP